MTYRHEFTDEQIQRAFNTNHTYTDAAKSLGVPRKTYTGWLKELHNREWLEFARLEAADENHSCDFKCECRIDTSMSCAPGSIIKVPNGTMPNVTFDGTTDYLSKTDDKATVDNKGILSGWVSFSTEPIVLENREKLNTQFYNSRILVISDMHIPYHHPDLLEFLKAIVAKYEPTRVIGIGDELDYHAMSFHTSDPDLDSAGTELAKARVVIQELYRLFPQMDLVHSNHGSMAYRRGKEHGIPKHMLKGYNEVLGVGDGWQWHEDITLELPNGQFVNFHHGRGSDVGQVSRNMGMSFVQGHYHHAFKIDYWGNPLALNWGMNVGCLIDDHSLAFAYNKLTAQRPVIGVGMIIDSQPKLIPLVKLKNGRWNKEIN